MRIHLCADKKDPPAPPSLPPSLVQLQFHLCRIRRWLAAIFPYINWNCFSFGVCFIPVKTDNYSPGEPPAALLYGPDRSGHKVGTESPHPGSQRIIS